MMSASPVESGFWASLFGDPDMDAVFSTARFIGYMLEVEAMLAGVEARLGIIPVEAGETIAAQAPALAVDEALWQAGLEKDGVPVIELVRQLREFVGGDAASYVHFGATTQDIMDTALVLQIREALSLIESRLQAVIENLARLADDHRHTLMAGRTHSQQAVPISFGLKVAGWLAPLLRHWQRLNEIKPRILVVQLGGAAGTLAPLGEQGVEVQAALAEGLKLGVPLMPWHTQRDTLAELAGWLSLVSGGLAKMAQDIILLAQTEIGEVNESPDRARGGSSTMPQKHNPVISEQIIACARTNAALLSSMHHALVQEHERGTHGWQVEWLALPRMFALAATALRKAGFLSQHLDVDEERMRQNMRASTGLMLAEAITYALSANSMSRADARKLVAEACQIAVRENRHLADVVREQSGALLDWDKLKREENHLGSTQAFIDRVLDAAAKCSVGKVFDSGD